MAIRHGCWTMVVSIDDHRCLVGPHEKADLPIWTDHLNRDLFLQQDPRMIVAIYQLILWILANQALT